MAQRRVTTTPFRCPTRLLREPFTPNTISPRKYQSSRSDVQTAPGGIGRPTIPVVRPQGPWDSTPSVTKQGSAVEHLGSDLLANSQGLESFGVPITSSHPAAQILDQSGVVIQRQIEMMNIFLGFEQANRYIIMNSDGEHVGYMVEQGDGVGKTLGRQILKTHRAFTTHVFNKERKEVLRVGLLASQCLF